MSKSLWVTIKRCIELTGLSYTSIRTRINNGRFVAVKDGSRWMIDIHAYFASLEDKKNTIVFNPTDLPKLPKGGLSSFCKLIKQDSFEYKVKPNI